MDTKLTIIIPVYNVEKYIIQCLSSIQVGIGARNDIEVIVVDDGSPDHSIEVAGPILNKMPYAKLIRQKNKGLSVARNVGLDLARGEYVWFIDSDDWLLPNAIDDINMALLRNPESDVISTILLEYYEDTKQIHQEYYPKVFYLSGKRYIKLRYKQGASQRYIFKKKFLHDNKLNFYPNIIHEDGLFGYIMLYYAKSVVILEKPVYAYRIRQKGSIMSNVTMRTPKCMLQIHKQLMEFCNKIVDEDDRTWYREEIFKVIINLFVFSKNLAFKKEFTQFYKLNRDYFNNEADYMLKNRTQLSKALMIRYYPLLLMRIKYVLHNYIKR